MMPVPCLRAWVLVWLVTRLGCSLDQCVRVIVSQGRKMAGISHHSLIHQFIQSFHSLERPGLLYRWRNKNQERTSDLPKVTPAQG